MNLPRTEPASGDDVVDALYDATKLVAAQILEDDLTPSGVVMLYRIHCHLSERYLHEAERQHSELITANDRLRREIMVMRAMRMPTEGRVS